MTQVRAPRRRPRKPAKTARRKPATRTPKAPPLDPVSQYARDVLDKRIVAGRAVRLACQRHFDDLARQRTRDFPYYWDPKAAQRIIDFYPTFLVLEDGSPFVLPPWLQFSYGSIYGWKRAIDGLRRFQHAFLETSKGSGKTPGMGGIGLYGLAFDNEPHAQVYSTGFDEEQAALCLKDAIRMVHDAPNEDFRTEFITSDAHAPRASLNIAHPSSGSFFRAMSSQHQSKSGPRPSYVLSDEIHEHRNGTVVSKAEAGFKLRKQPLGMKSTNSGADKTSYCWELHQKSLDVLEGTAPDEQWFAYVCHLDPCDKCYGEGYRQPKDGCLSCDDWTDPGVWPKVAPALGIVIQEKYLHDQVAKAQSIPSEYSLIRRLNFCIWTETHQVWIPPDRWEACRVNRVRDANPEHLACAAGLDPSSVHDLTALAVCLRIDDPPEHKAEEIEFEGLDEHGEQVRYAYRLNFHVEIVPYFWLPQGTLLERVRKDKIPLDAWARDGRLFTTPGDAIDHNAIYDFIIGDKRKGGKYRSPFSGDVVETPGPRPPGAWDRFHIQKLGMDENSGRFLFMKLRDEGRLGDKIVSVGQGKKLSEAFKFIEILIAHRRLHHDGHPVQAWCMANAEPKRDARTGALWLEKPADHKLIDGAVALAMGIKELMALPTVKKKRGIVFV